MNSHFFFISNIVMISRLLFTFRDESVKRKQIFYTILIQLLGLLIFEINHKFVIIFVILVLIDILFFYTEKRTKKIIETRLLFFIIYLVIISIFSSSWVDLKIYPDLQDKLQSLGNYFVIPFVIKGVDWYKFNITLFGLLLVTNEVNLFIRFLLNKFKHAPLRTNKIDKQEYNAGRLIGILERILIYYFVLNSQYSAIGFILAAKSFTRYKELENREYAEYVLIGTLLSTLLAVFAATITLSFR